MTDQTGTSSNNEDFKAAHRAVSAAHQKFSSLERFCATLEERNADLASQIDTLRRQVDEADRAAVHLGSEVFHLKNSIEEKDALLHRFRAMHAAREARQGPYSPAYPGLAKRLLDDDKPLHIDHPMLSHPELCTRRADVKIRVQALREEAHRLEDQLSGTESDHGG